MVETSPGSNAMNYRRSLAVILLVFSTFTFTLAKPPAPATQSAEADAFSAFNGSWQTRPEWKKGASESVGYTVVDLAGKRVDGLALYRSVITRNSKADPVTKNLAVDSDKPGLRDVVVQTTSGRQKLALTWHTLVFVGAQDSKSLRLSFTAIESPGVGPVFKQIINHKGILTWDQFSAAPGNDSHTTGTFSPPRNLAYENALPLILRAYPFEGDHKPIDIALILDQTALKPTPIEPVSATIRYVGVESLKTDPSPTFSEMLGSEPAPNEKNTPAQLKTHHLIVANVSGDKESELHFWFAADEHDHLLIKSECHGVRLLLSGKPSFITP
jgi:hypothetical protein